MPPQDLRRILPPDHQHAPACTACEFRMGIRIMRMVHGMRHRRGPKRLAQQHQGHAAGQDLRRILLSCMSRGLRPEAMGHDRPASRRKGEAEELRGSRISTSSQQKKPWCALLLRWVYLHLCLHLQVVLVMRLLREGLVGLCGRMDGWVWIGDSFPRRPPNRLAPSPARPSASPRRRRNQIGDAGSTALAEGLRGLGSLQTLSLW